MTPGGWRRVDGRAGKCGAVWQNPVGWRLEHCGHPTANYPWTLVRPDGSAVTMAEAGCPGERGSWPARWSSRGDAMLFVAREGW